MFSKAGTVQNFPDISALFSCPSIQQPRIFHAVMQCQSCRGSSCSSTAQILAAQTGWLQLSMQLAGTCWGCPRVLCSLSTHGWTSPRARQELCPLLLPHSLPKTMTTRFFPAYPWDKSSLKSMPVDLQQFKKLDAYALEVSLAFASVLLPAPLKGCSMNLAPSTNTSLG